MALSPPNVDGCIVSHRRTETQRKRVAGKDVKGPPLVSPERSPAWFVVDTVSVRGRRTEVEDSTTLVHRPPSSTHPGKTVRERPLRLSLVQ